MNTQQPQNSQVSLPAYQESLFVNREAEIKAALDLAEKIRRGETLRTRTLVFTGMRAIGKSWLLHHLEGEISQLGFSVVYLNMKLFEGKEPSLVVKKSLEMLYKHGMGNEIIPDWIDLPDLSQKVMAEIRKWLESERKWLCVCVDHVYETDWEFLPLLEDYILAPLAIEPRVLLILAGRGRAFQFKTPELWFAESYELKPFDEKILEEQKEQMKKGGIEVSSTLGPKEIKDLSGGSPGAAYILMRSDVEKAFETMIEVVPEGEREKAKAYLLALCVLRVFDDLRIARMVRVHQGKQKDLDLKEAREIREALIRWGFATWDTEKGGYVLQPVLHNLAEAYLKEKQCDLWKSLHEAAISLYNEWGTKYPRGKDYWEKEREYHDSHLPEPCPAR